MAWRMVGMVSIAACGLCLGAAAQQIAAPPQTVAGRVENAQGEPASNAAVQLTAVDGTEAESQRTGADGTFSFVIYAAGPYQLTVITLQGEQQFTLTGGQTEGLVLHLSGNRRSPDGSGTATVSLNDLQAPANARAKLAAAEKALKKGDEARAWARVNEAIADAPAWGTPYGVRAAIRFSRKDYQGARGDLDVAVTRNPQNAMALTELGRVEFILGDNPDAERYLGRALQLPPVRWPTYLEMGNLDLRLHRYAQAKQMAETALACQPAAPPAAYFLIGEASFYSHHYKDAKKAFLVYLAKLPDTPANARGRAAAKHNLKYLKGHGLIP